MKTNRNIIAIAFAGAVAASGAVNAAEAGANGFAPWANTTVVDTPDARQAEVTIKPWGVEASQWQYAASVKDRRDGRQAQIVIRPWYARGAI